MIIVADDAIPQVEAALGGLGELRTAAGRAIDAAMVRDADVLVTRSVTRVDAALLDGSRVRLVATATAGVDHLDIAWLESRRIAWTSAAGANARAVAEYVVTALYTVHAPPGPVGIVGYGNIGRTLAPLMRALGREVVVCDPPLQARAPSLAPFESLSALLDRAAVVTVHVPLTHTGQHPTHHLIDPQRLRPGALLINTSRGGVVDDTALGRWLARGRGRAVLDVWEGEPHLDTDLVDKVALATPHIAGYTLEGKLAATRTIHEAVARVAGVRPGYDGDQVLGPPEAIRAADRRSAVLTACPLDQDDAALRAAPGDPLAFERMRRSYAPRRQFAHFEVPADPVLNALGFATLDP